MTGVGKEITNVIALAAVFVGIFVIGELIRRRISDKPEISRKFVHFLSGLTALSFPYVLSSHWAVLVITGSFAIGIMLAKKKGILRSLHGVKRKSLGEIYFPVSIYLVFLLAHTQPVLYFIAVLVMTISDALAAVIGEKYGTIKFDVEGNVKSLEGSITFFFTTFLCIHLPLLLMTQTGRPESVLIAFVIALLVTGFEAISLSGSDNIFVPLGTYYFLAKMIQQPLSTNIRSMEILLSLIALTVVTCGKFLGASGVIGIVLINYAAWSLCDFYWFLGIFLGEVMYIALVVYFRHKTTEKIGGYQVRTVLYVTVLPIVLIFVANTTGNYAALYLPYLTSIVAQLAMIFCFYSRLAVIERTQSEETSKSNKLMKCVVSTAASTLFIAGIPLLLLQGVSEISSICIVGIGTLLVVYPFLFLMKRYHLEKKQLPRERVRLAGAGVASALVFAVQTLIHG